MRCPNCNQWNRATLPRCIRCGTDLRSDTPVTPSWRADLKDDRAGKEYIRIDEDGDVSVTPDDREVLAAEMAELKARKDDGAIRLERLRQEARMRTEPPRSNTAVQSDASPEPFDLADQATRRSARVNVSGLEPAASDPAAQDAQPQAHAAPAARNPRGTRVILHTGQWNDTRSYDPIVDDMQHSNVFKQPPNLQELPETPSRKRRMNQTVRTVTILLVVVVLALAGTILAVGLKESRKNRYNNNGPTITASLQDDLSSHTISIPGEDGQKIYINELHNTYEVIDGYATIVIPDHFWYDDLDVITEESMTVKLTPSVKVSGGRQEPLPAITYDITIPLSPIELVTPTASRIEVATPMYSMLFNVREGSHVFINGEDMSDAVDENGQLIYNATVHPIGDNVYNVEVRSPYCRNNSMTVTLYREAQEIPLDLDATTYTSTHSQKYKITATTLPGAEVDVLSPHSDLNITNLDTTGEFTFIAIFDKIGYNTVTIEASYPGKKTSHVEYTIYYLPNVDDYTRKAWSLTKSADYAELVGNISFRASRAQIYVAMGKVDHFVSTEPQMAVMYCSDDGLSQPVLLENQTKTVWKEGQYYRIYADVFGSYNGMPWLVARYTFLD